MPEPLKLLRLPLVSEMSASVKSVVASLKVAVTEKVELMGSAAALVSVRSEERRVGKGWRSRGAPYHLTKK